MKPIVYLTDSEAMRKARLNQPRVSSEEFRAQLEAFWRVRAQPSTDAKAETALCGRAKVTA